MRVKLVSLLLLVPFFASSQFIVSPNNYPVFTYNQLPGTDHATDVHNYYTQTVMTGFYTQQTEFWGYDASTTAITLLNGVADPSNFQSFFATAHNASGGLSWFITSQQTSGATNTYGTSKMAFNPNTGTYVFCVEYRVTAIGDPLQLFSSASGAAGILAPGLYGLLNVHVDGSGNILNVCSAASSSAPVLLGDIDLDEGTGMVYATGYRQGGVLTRAFVLSYMPGTCGGGATVSPGAPLNNSWGRGIEVESGEVFAVGDYENTVVWGGFTGTALGTASQDIYLVKFDPALNPTALTVAGAQFYGEGYDVEVFQGPSETYVSGSVQQNATGWSVGNFGVSFPGALHGFIQVFDPATLASTCNFVRVPATGNNEFFKMVDLEQNVAPVTGNTGVITIGGNMNHPGPTYEFYGGCVLSTSTPLSALLQEAGFVLRVNDHPEPMWTNISNLVTNPMDPAPTVTAVSNFEDDIFVGGYKNEDVTLTPSTVGDLIPNLGNPTMNAYYTYIYSDPILLIGDFLKTTPTVVEQAEEEDVRFAVYPNPASDVLYLRMDDAVQLQQVLLKDLAGRTIQAWNGHEAAGGLAVGDIPTGIYFLEIEGNGVRATERVVIH